MNTKLIEQIKQIKGVKTVIPTGETCVVTFEPEEKTLEHYEMTLLDSSTVPIAYQYLLKRNDPEEFYLKVLRLIADDLNGDFIPSKKTGAVVIRKTNDREILIVQISYNDISIGEIVFRSLDAAKTAIRIMGDKLKFLNEK